MPDPLLVSAPRFEHHVEALGIDERSPRLSWQVAAERPGWWQEAYEVEVDRGGGPWRSGRIDHDESVLVAWPTTPLTAREQARVRVRVWGLDDRTPSPWSAVGLVEAGLGPDDWVAKLVGPPQASSERAPQPLVRGRFVLDADVARARLYATGHGVHDLELNGRPVGDQVLSPGWTSYEHRLRYHTHDVTDLLRPGDNVLGAWLGPGWYAGRLGFHGGREHVWGDRVGLLAQLEVDTADGRRVTVASDQSWQWRPGPILQASIYDGETFDARRVVPGWSAPRGDDDGWSPVTGIARDPATLVAPTGPPVRCTEEVHPVSVERLDDDTLRLDFGVNVVGRLRLRASGPSGTTIRVRHAEVLEDGALGVRPLRRAAATDTWVLGGDAVEEWEPRFTFHGFRYAEVTGWPGEFAAGAVVARVLHSDLGRTGWFSCSDQRVNQLHDNVVRSMRGNFLDVPTDCPQRDERLGWTGDLQVFADTASFLYDCAGTLTSWLRDVAADQADDGTVPVYVPWFEIDESWRITDQIAGWGDVAVLTPWTLHERFGDEQLLRDQFDSARAWVERLAAEAPDGVVRDGMQRGAWPPPAPPPHDPADARTDRYLVATAYLVHSAGVLAAIARRLGEEADAERFEALARQVRGAFQDEWVRPDGLLRDAEVTGYALAIVFGLLGDHAQVTAAGRRLVELVEGEGHHIATGFAGTPVVLHALTMVGADDTAYELLMQTQRPSWLYAVELGATTIWERWDSMLPDGSINPGEMTSFNHYALGAVADWLHARVAGLAPAAPGLREVLVAPRPGGGLDAAEARLVSPYGPMSVAWERRGDLVALDVVLPPNTRGTIRVPDDAIEDLDVGSGRHHVEFTAPDVAG